MTDVLREAGIDPTTFVLEVTESVLADPDGGAAAALAALRGSRVRVALDDFGTGYSSIGYLQQLPVDILKIDRSFVSGPSAGTGVDDVLLEAIVAMGQTLRLDVIPEGIEELDQLVRLRAAGCKVGQGFLFSRPVSVQAIEVLLASPIPLPVVALAGEHGVVPPHGRSRPDLITDAGPAPLPAPFRSRTVPTPTPLTGHATDSRCWAS